MALEEQYKNYFQFNEDDSDDPLEINEDTHVCYGNVIPNTNIMEMGMSVPTVIVKAMDALDIKEVDDVMNLPFFCGMILDKHIKIEVVPKKFHEKIRLILAYISENYIFEATVQDEPYMDYKENSLVSVCPGKFYDKMIRLAAKVETVEDYVSKIGPSDDPIMLAAYDRGLVPCYRVGPYLRSGRNLYHMFEVIGQRKRFGHSNDMYRMMIEMLEINDAIHMALTCKAAYDSYIIVNRALSYKSRDMLALSTVYSVLANRDISWLYSKSTHIEHSPLVESQFQIIKKNYRQRYKSWYFCNAMIAKEEREFKSVPFMVKGCHLHRRILCVECIKRRRYVYFKDMEGRYASPFFEFIMNQLSSKQFSMVYEQIIALRSLREYAPVFADVLLQMIFRSYLPIDDGKLIRQLKFMAYTAPYYYINYGTPYLHFFPSLEDMQMMNMMRPYDKFHQANSLIIRGVKRNLEPRLVRRRRKDRSNMGESYDYAQEMEDLLYFYDIGIGSATANGFFQNTISIIASEVSVQVITMLKKHGFILRQTLQQSPDMSKLLFYFTTDPQRVEMDPWGNPDVEEMIIDH